MDSSDTGGISTVATEGNVVRVLTILGEGSESKIGLNNGTVVVLVKVVTKLKYANKSGKSK